MTFLKKTIKSNQNIELYKFNGENFITLPQNFHDENTIKVCFLDLETTGTNKESSKIIEFAGKLAVINKVNGELTGIIDSYQSFNDPEELISPVITRITGITNKDVEGYSLDWEIISSIRNKADSVVAHNATSLDNQRQPDKNNKPEEIYDPFDYHCCKYGAYGGFPSPL